MNNPLITIIIPSFNQGKSIKRTIQSVLKQEYPGKIELIVSDGGSTDDTVDILKQYGNDIIWWSEKDDGWADAVKKGLDAASGDIIGIQNSDDFYLEGAFNTVYEVFSTHPSIGMVTGSYCTFNESNKSLEIVNVPEGIYGCRSVFFYPGVYQHSTFFRKEALHNVNDLFIIKFHGAEWELFYKMLHFSRGLYIPKEIAIYTRHEGQITQSNTNYKFTEAVTQIIEYCEKKSLYSDQFMFSPWEKEDIFSYMSLAWGNYLRTPDKGEGILKRILTNKTAYSWRTVDIASQIWNGRYPQKLSLYNRILKSINHESQQIKQEEDRYPQYDKKLIQKLQWYE